MRKHNLNGSRLAGSIPGIILLALVIWGGRAFGGPQDESAARPTNGQAPNSAITWAPRVRDSAQRLSNIFRYTNFNNVSGLTLNGNAQPSGLRLILTPAQVGQAGSVWYSNQVNVGQGFQTTFEFQIDPSFGCVGDGLAFVVQNSSLSALGMNGGMIGYGGIANSLAVEFDTFQNGGCDTNSNHIAVQSCGVEPNTSDECTCNLGFQPNLPITLADGVKHAVFISYVPGSGGSQGMLTVKTDRQVVLTSSLNLSTLLSLNGNDAWVGFTGATGECLETNAIRAWGVSTVGTAYGQE